MSDLNSTDEQWFALKSYNTETIYAWGTEADADKFCDLWNEDRDVNHWHYQALSEAEADGLRLDRRDDVIVLAGAISDLEEGREQDRIERARVR